MLSDRIYRLIASYARFLGRIGCNPFKWDPVQQLLVHCPASRRRTITSIYFMSIWAVFGIVQAIRFIIAKDQGRLSEVLVLLIPGSLVYGLFCLMVVKVDEIYVLGNSSLIYIRHIHRAYLPEFDPNKSKLSLLLEGGVFLFFLGIIFFCIPCTACMIVLLRKRAMFLMSVLPDETPLLVQVLAGVYHLWVCIQFYFNLYTICIITFGIDVVIMPFNLWEFRLGRKRYFAPDRLRQPPLLLTAYRAVQLFQIHINNLIGNIILPVQNVVGMIIVFSIFINASYGEDLGPSATLLLYGWAIIAYVIWSLCLYMGGLINHHGKKILNSWIYKGKWSSAEERKLVLKFRKSCPPLSVSYGRIWVLQKTTLLRFTMSLTKVLVRTFLTFGEKH